MNSIINEKLVAGEMTIAEAVGLGRERLYTIAGEGHKLFSSGRYEEARTIFAGLAAADPFDSVFHCHLGACLWRLGDEAGARREYDAALRLNFANVDALAARGELRLIAGDVRGGIADLRGALEHDRDGRHPSSIRARALILALAQKQKS